MSSEPVSVEKRQAEIRHVRERFAAWAERDRRARGKRLITGLVLFVTGGLEGVEFRGYEIDVDVARMTFEYLESAVERALTARRRAGDFPAGRSAAYDYRIGFAAEVCKRVEAMVAERERAERTASSTGTALTVREREIVDRECGAELRTNRSTHRGVRDREAAAAGRADGAQVSLDPQVERGEVPPWLAGST